MKEPLSAESTAIHTAASWFLRRDSGHLSSADESAFQAWLSASEQNRVVFESVRSTWQVFDAPTLSGRLEVLRAEALSVASRRRTWPLIAAGIVLAIVLPILAILVSWQGRRGEMPAATGAPAMQHFAGTADHISTVTLSDGTSVTLSFNADISAQITPSKRQVVLNQGQAFFAVSKDPKRPFTVDAGDQHVSAVGTQFDVRREPDRVEVVLLEGKVSVRDTGNAQVDLSPGQRLIAAGGKPPLVFKVDAQRLTGWRRGWISFDNEALGDAVEEFNRYSMGPPILTDPAVGSLRLGGVFRLGRPDRFAAVVQELLPVKAVADSAGKIQLVRLRTK
jgi:transmembrane sensor